MSSWSIFFSTRLDSVEKNFLIQIKLAKNGVKYEISNEISIIEIKRVSVYRHQPIGKRNKMYLAAIYKPYLNGSSRDRIKADKKVNIDVEIHNKIIIN